MLTTGVPFLKLKGPGVSDVQHDVLNVTARVEALAIVFRHSTSLECDDLSGIILLSFTNVTP